MPYNIETSFSRTRLSDLRVARGLSKHALARRMGISWTQVQEWERGWRKASDGRRPTRPTFATVQRLADALGVEYEDLLDG